MQRKTVLVAVAVVVATEIANSFLIFDVYVMKEYSKCIKKICVIRSIYDLICLNTSMKDDGNDHFSFYVHIPFGIPFILVRDLPEISISIQSHF